MNGRLARVGLPVFSCALAAMTGLAWPAAASRLAAQAPAAQVYKGLSLTATAMTRSKNVSLRDCPPGANTQRGVIRPIDNQEFVTVTLDVKVLPSFEPVLIGKPTLADVAGRTYNTAQSFTNVGSASAYSCDFSFRVPTGTVAARLTIDDVSLDLAHLKK